MYKDYSPEFYKHLEQCIEQARKNSVSPLCAAFDADGTLWDTDVQDIIFADQIAHPYLSLPPQPLEFYHQLKHRDPRAAYLWLAQLLSGLSLPQVLQHNEQSFQRWEAEYGPIPIFPPQKALIDFLKAHEVEVWVVTASVQWSLYYPARYLGIEPDCILGVKTCIEQGLITDKPDGPVTYRDGKAEALRAKIGAKKLILCVGNSIGDYELLASSEGLAMAVCAAKATEEVYASEQELQELAQQQNWWRHAFRD